jgi:hypothetical protein
MDAVRIEARRQMEQARQKLTPEELAALVRDLQK